MERFSIITQGIIYLAACQLKEIGDKALQAEKNKPKEKPKNESIEQTEAKKAENQERDKLLILVSKVFLLNFPLYVAFKHTLQVKLDDLTQSEIQNLNVFCDLHDSEIPIYLLKNVTLFCKLGGLHAMTLCFTHLSPEALQVSTAHAMISIGK